MHSVYSRSNSPCSFVNYPQNYNHSVFHLQNSPTRTTHDTMSVSVIGETAISCHYCGEQFNNHAAMKSHVQNMCTRKKYSFGHGCCKDCGNHFKKYESYVKHLELTGHMNHMANPAPKPPSTSPPLSQSPSMKNKGAVSQSCYGVVGSSKCSSITSSPSRTPMISPSRPMYLPSSDLHSLPPPIESRQFLLRFGAVVRPEFQMGASAWCLQDLFGSVVAQGAMPMKEDTPSLIHGEYGALLHGLEVTKSLSVKNLKIQCCSEFIVTYFSGQPNPHFQAVLNQVEDITSSIRFLMNQFQKVVFEHVSTGFMTHVLRLAEVAVEDAVMLKSSPRLSEISLSSRSNLSCYDIDIDRQIPSVPPGLGFGTGLGVSFRDSWGSQVQVDDLTRSDTGYSSKSLTFPSISELSPWLVCKDNKPTLPHVGQSMLF